MGRHIRVWQVVVTSLLILLLVVVVGRAAPGQAGGDLKDHCVLEVGDLNGDEVSDQVVSQRGDSPDVVYVLLGRQSQTSAPKESRSVRETAAFVLRGAAAAPFACHDPQIRRALGSRGLRPGNAIRRRPLSSSPMDAAATYTLVDLDPLMPGHPRGFSSVANGINARGQVVGRFFTERDEHAFVYDPGGVRSLGTLGGHISDARDINDAGEIVGYSLTGEVDSSGFVNAAFVSDGYSMQDLRIRWSSAEAINNRRQIVGAMRVEQDVDLSHAFFLEQGTVTDLGSLPLLNAAARSVAWSIDESGRVVGESETFVTGNLNPAIRHPALHAFLYRDGVMRDVGTLGKFCLPLSGTSERCIDRSTATDVNNHGDVAGFSTTPGDGSVHAFVTAGTRLQDLGTLGGTSSWAYGVNDSGQVVGGSVAADGRLVPFLYDRGTMYDLNSLISEPTGTVPFVVYAINNFGQIVGNHHVLTPVYETIAPGREMSFTAALGASFTFEYRVSRPDTEACLSARNAAQLQVRIDAAAGGAGTWLPVARLSNCGGSSDWARVSLNVPEDLRGRLARFDIRVPDSLSARDLVVYLRRFTKE